MFTTRMFFDTFTSILHANGVLHTMIFILYGLGVYCMTVNIAAVTDDISIAAICSGGIGNLRTQTALLTDIYTNDLSPIYLHRLLQASNSSSSAGHSFGSCHQVENFDFGFALSFLFTRSLIFVLFFLYCTVFHHTKSHAHGINAGQNDKLRDANKINTSSIDKNNDIELTSTAISEPNINDRVDSLSNRAISVATTRTASTTTATATATHRAHINKVFIFKIIPLIVSCIVMLCTFADFSTVVLFPMVAIIEIVGDVIPEHIVNMEGIKPDRHNLEERLGLMFMLVLGETMLGFLVQRGNSVIDAKTYSTLIPAYILVIAVGMQYFKNAQFPHLAPGKHPLDRPVYSAIYTWLSAMLSFLMLVAANGLVEIYNEISDLGARSESVQERVEMKKISVCLFGVWVIMLCLHLLEGSYWHVIVRSLWVKLCHVLRRCMVCVTGDNSATHGKNSHLPNSNYTDRSTGQTPSNPIHGTTTSTPAQASLPETKLHATSLSHTRDNIDCDIPPAINAAGDHSRTSNSERPSIAEPSRYPYSTRNARHTLHHNNDYHHTNIINNTGKNASTVDKGSTPAIFNKRLFFLRLGVAFVHLYTHTFNIDAQYFIVVNALVALVPQLAEAILEFIDLQQRLSRIRRELELKVDDT